MSNYSVEKIKGKNVYEIYTPAGANKSGHTDRDAFEQVVGNTNFHSFQVWRSKEDGKPTVVYALSLEQITAICTRQKREVSGLKGRITKLLLQIKLLLPLANEAGMLTAENARLLAMKIKAKQMLDEYKAREDARKPVSPTVIRGVISDSPLVGNRSLTGKGSAGLCAEAVGKADEFRGTVRG